MALQQDTLAAQALQQLFGEQGDGMPVILARRIDPQIPTTYNLHDYGFEGLRPVSRGGKQAWEVYHDFVLSIDGKTGNCRIPDTERNRKRLERLSKGERETFTRVTFDQGSGEQKMVEEFKEIPPTYQRVEDNLAQSTLVDTLAQRVLDMMRQNNMPTTAPSGPSPDLTEQAAAVPIKRGRGRYARAATSPAPAVTSEPLLAGDDVGRPLSE